MIGWQWQRWQPTGEREELCPPCVLCSPIRALTHWPQNPPNILGEEGSPVPVLPQRSCDAPAPQQSTTAFLQIDNTCHTLTQQKQAPSKQLRPLRQEVSSERDANCISLSLSLPPSLPLQCILNATRTHEAQRLDVLVKSCCITASWCSSITRCVPPCITAWAGKDCCYPGRMDAGLLYCAGLPCGGGWRTRKGGGEILTALHHPDMAKEGTPTQSLPGTASYRHQVEAKPGFPKFTRHVLQFHAVLVLLHTRRISHIRFMLAMNWIKEDPSIYLTRAGLGGDIEDLFLEKGLNALADVYIGGRVSF
ncbi:hypothetical protein JZ751_006999 [Albula glossodonta]|uniref:Uncharacterized protein n=1 Tax=Albula glossodonta TaxID=121402 RepID=A0A8T2PD77_9TELE|nr:hypothetical protein JZ751_006999 [Albula glossodonta]